MIEVRHLNKIYDKGRRNANQVLHDVSLTLPETGFVCILGPSGCGKTSLLNAIGGLDTFESGTVSTGEVSVSKYGTHVYEAERNRSFGYIFQNYYLLMNHTVAYNVYMGLHSLELSHEEKLKRVRQALKAVDMEHYIRRTVGELSGGQQQRVAIARALARRPRVIFADEPTGNLDEANTLKICTILRKISKNSLVVMVTHEERIANFFADRIITLDNGRIRQDDEEWQRGSLSGETGKTIYAGDYTEASCSGEKISFRVLKEEGAAPVALTLIAEKDRIVIKLDDTRAVSCVSSKQPPILREGKRPTLSLEEMDRDESAADELFMQPPAVRAKAGQGITPGMMLKEARQLAGGHGVKRLTMRFFLVLLAVLTLLIVSDYLTVSSLDPEDFITTDSHILEIKLEYGPKLQGNAYLQDLSVEYINYLRESDAGYLYVPHVAATATYSVDLFRQMDMLELTLGSFSYVPVTELDESTLICGRIPENSGEVVVDRWVLDAVAEQDGILQNSITDSSYFLGCTLTYSKRTYAPTIVGICDSGEPSVYITEAGLISVGSGGKEVMTLSDLKSICPGQYDDITLEKNECIVVTTTAGTSYADKVGTTFRINSRTEFMIVDTIEADVYAALILADEALNDMLWNMTSERFYLYCEDKTAVKAFLAEGSVWEESGYIVKTVKDKHTDTWNEYDKATSLQTNARTIVTVTVIALAMVMLYLLCRAQIQERLGMLSVYRLLGIPKRKLAAIFALESLISSLTTILPAAVLTWGVITVVAKIPEWNVALILPWQAAAAVYGFILVYYILVSLLPLRKLLKMPPARLAAKYDM